VDDGSALKDAILCSKKKAARGTNESDLPFSPKGKKLDQAG